MCPGPIWLYELVITSGCLPRAEPGLDIGRPFGELVKLDTTDEKFGFVLVRFCVNK